MAEHRNEPRNLGYAKVILNNFPAYLRNLTFDGCKIVSIESLPCNSGDTAVLQIIPEENTGIKSIDISAELRWSREEAPYYTYGFKLIGFNSPEDETNYNKLVAIYDRQ